VIERRRRSPLGGRRLPPDLCLEDHGDGAVVDELDLHARAEDACLDVDTEVA
jgi:hypothetical protein